ncbi:MAG: HEAT repeat domain-containing protein, partial [Polyangiaceae bacterium]
MQPSSLKYTVESAARPLDLQRERFTSSLRGASIEAMRVTPMRVALGVTLLASIVLTPSTRARAAARLHHSAAPLAVALAPDAVKRLKSGDITQIKSALDDVRMSGTGGAPAVPAIVELLQGGLPPSLAQAAIETLGDVQGDRASGILGWYSHDRDVGLRRAAVEALSGMHGEAPVAALRAALSDPDEAVRGLAATGLGIVAANPNTKDTVVDLFTALDHRVFEAAASIGELCDPSECQKLAGKLGSVPFGVMSDALDHALMRPPKNLDDASKISIVASVRELGTAEAHQFLKDVQSKWPKGGSVRVRQA